MVNGVLLLLAGLTAAAWWGSGLPYSRVLEHANGLAQDGTVETYTAALHAQVQGRLRMLAVCCGSLTAALLLLRSRMRPSVTAPGDGPLAVFRADVKRAWDDRRTDLSPMHGRLVLSLIMIGALLRAALLWQPITYDEAFTFTYYASRPLHILVADYSYPNNHILHTILVKLTTSLFGVGLVSLRLPAFLAGVMALPVFFLVVRSLFNRDIALLALALACGSGPLLDQSAMARGYSLTCLLMVTGLGLAHYLVRKDRTVAAVLLGICCALGLWAVPSFVYSAGMIYGWSAMAFLRTDEHRRARWPKLLLSGLVFIVVSFLLYLPVILISGLEQITNHPIHGVADRELFERSFHHRAIELWVALAETSTWWMPWLGVIALCYSAVRSSTYRALLVALLLGAAPLVVLQGVVAPPRVWVYSVFLFHIGSALALHHLLAWVQARFRFAPAGPGLLAWAGLVLLAGVGWTGLRVERLGKGGMPEAAWCAQQALALLGPGDKLYTHYPWNAPIEFHVLALGGDRSLLYGPVGVGKRVLVAVGPDYAQTLESVLHEHQMVPATLPPFRRIHDRPRLKIFAAP